MNMPRGDVFFRALAMPCRLPAPVDFFARPAHLFSMAVDVVRGDGAPMGSTGTFHLKRVYAPPAAEDGVRVLVDGLWPRGLSKDKAKVDLWLKEIAPSTALRQWFNHDPERWDAFRRKYEHELKDNEALDELSKLVRRGRVTLLFAARDEHYNNAVVLEQLLRSRR